MENIIYNELLCRGYSVDIGVVEIVERSEGKRTKKQCEIDFVANLGAKKYYIQLQILFIFVYFLVSGDDLAVEIWDTKEYTYVGKKLQ